MSNIGSPPPDSLPPSRTLVKSTLIALAVAALLLVVVILPAEFGVDPTGIGRVIGLKEMGEIKMQLAREAAAADSAARNVAVNAPASALPVAAPSQAPMERVDTVRVALQPNQGREIKLAMRKDARVAFSWRSEGGPVNYDMHADRKADPEIKYFGYKKGQNVAVDSGQLVASFEGMHGWFWRNRTRAPVTVVLTVRGGYTEWKEIK
jgi:hypothetical protein